MNKNKNLVIKILNNGQKLNNIKDVHLSSAFAYCICFRHLGPTFVLYDRWIAVTKGFTFFLCASLTRSLLPYIYTQYWYNMFIVHRVVIGHPKYHSTDTEHTSSGPILQKIGYDSAWIHRFSFFRWLMWISSKLNVDKDFYFSKRFFWANEVLSKQIANDEFFWIFNILVITCIPFEFGYRTIYKCSY